MNQCSVIACGGGIVETFENVLFKYFRENF